LDEFEWQQHYWENYNEVAPSDNADDRIDVSIGRQQKRMDTEHTNTKNNIRRSIQPALITGLVLTGLLVIWFLSIRWYRNRLLEDQRSTITAQISLQVNALSAALNRRIALLEGLHAFAQSVEVTDEFEVKFNAFAANLFESTPGILDLAIAPGGEIYYVYPVEGNVQIIGYNPLEDPRLETRNDVLRAIDTGQVILSRPYGLDQGGNGLVARKAVFKDGDYWGLVNIVMDLGPILERSNIRFDNDILLLLKNNRGEIVYGSEELFVFDPLVQRIELPDGWWELYAAPAGGWEQSIRSNLLIFAIGGLVILILVTSIVFLTASRQTRLAHAVSERTNEIYQVNLLLQEDIAQRKKTESKLVEQEAQYHSIFESVNDGLFIFDLSGNMVDFNPAAATLHGYSTTEFRSLTPEDFIHQETMPIFHQFLNAVKQGQPFIGRGVDYRKDGSKFQFQVRGTPFRYAHKDHALAMLRDVSEEVEAYKLLEKRVQERTRELVALLDISRTINSTLGLTDLVAVILEQLKSVVEYTGAGVVELEENIYHFVEYIGPAPRDQVLAIRIPQSGSSAYQNMRLKPEPVIYNDIWANLDLSSPFPEGNSPQAKATFAYAHAWLGVPLIVKGEFLGVLRVDHETPQQFSEGGARLLIAFANQVAVAIENARLYHQAQALAATQEREKLARELHDSVSQALYGIALGARTADELIRQTPEITSSLSEPIVYILDLVEVALAEMRALIFELRPESIEKEGLVVALQKHVAAVQARNKIPISLNVFSEPHLPLSTKEACYRIAQEAIQNSVKHAQASHITLLLSEEGQSYCLKITDDGRGFDIQKDYPGHLGLKSMRERIERLDGELIIDSIPGSGTTIAACFKATSN